MKQKSNREVVILVLMSFVFFTFFGELLFPFRPLHTQLECQLSNGNFVPTNRVDSDGQRLGHCH